MFIIVLFCFLFFFSIKKKGIFAKKNRGSLNLLTMLSQCIQSC